MWEICGSTPTNVGLKWEHILLADVIGAIQAEPDALRRGSSDAFGFGVALAFAGSDLDQTVAAEVTKHCGGGESSIL